MPLYSYTQSTNKINGASDLLLWQPIQVIFEVLIRLLRKLVAMATNHTKLKFLYHFFGDTSRGYPSIYNMPITLLR